MSREEEQIRKVVIGVLHELLQNAEDAFRASGDSLTPSESLKQGLLMTEQYPSEIPR